MAVLLQARPDRVGAFSHFRARGRSNKSFRMTTIQISSKTKGLKSFVFIKICKNREGEGDIVNYTFPTPVPGAILQGDLMTRVYLDFNATTPVEPAVLDAMLPYLSGEFANASSIHTPGQRARAAVETAREQVAALIGAKPQEIVFTSGGTESDNHAIFGVAASVAQALLPARSSPHSGQPAGQTPPRHVITTTIEHEAVLNACQALEKRGVAASVAQALLPAQRSPHSGQSAGQTPPRHVITTTIEHEAVLNACQALEKQAVSVTYLEVDRDGLVNLASVEAAIRPETALITIMHANNELGTVQPLEEIGRIARNAGACFHTDAVQSAGKIPIDVQKLGVDLLSLSAHKLYGPKGIGALYVRSGTRIQQLLYGGHHQRGFRPGTENVAGIVGFGKAAELARQSLGEDCKRVATLRDQLERGLLARIPDARVNGAGAPRTPNTTNITFSGIEGEALLIALDLKGLAVSTGAACSSGTVEPSHVLTAIGLPAEEARASLRFSLGRHTTPAEIEFALQVVPAAVAQLRSIAPPIRKEVTAR